MKAVGARGRILVILAVMIVAIVLLSTVGGCSGPSAVKSSRMAIIRIDDIQAYSLEDISMRMIDDAKDLDIPVSLGVIPKGIEDNTPIRNYLEDNLCWIEVAQHGWDHNGPTPDVPEFRDADFASASADILRGKQVLEDLTGEEITTFIPPENALSTEARRSVSEAGIQIISSTGYGVFDYGAATFDYQTDLLNSAEKVLNDCAKRVSQTQSCVVMIHPQDFVKDEVLDTTKYQVYLDLLSMLKAGGYTFVRFKDLAEAI